MRKAVLWPYRYADMKVSWVPQTHWLVSALAHHGFDVRRHGGFQCDGLQHLPEYNHATDNPCALAIYNHCDQSELTGNCVKANRNWFVKPTVPDNLHTTLDVMGYGPYSSVSYRRPPLEHMPTEAVDKFFSDSVSGWIDAKTTKYGGRLPLVDSDLDCEDYYLVLGQCNGDSVVTRHDFGDYLCKMHQVVRELLRVDSRPIVVKLHPYMDGEDAQTHTFSESVSASLRDLDKRVRVFTGGRSVHDFVSRARAVLLANSGAGFDAMFHGKPVIAWGYPEYHWVSYDLRHLADLRRALAIEHWHRPEMQRAFVYWYLCQYCYYDRDSAVRRIGEILTKGY